jgi:hypothetical protein
MATFVLTDGRFFLNGFDMSGHTQSMTLDLTADEVDVTSINSGGFRSKIAGLQDASLTANGFFEAGTDKPDGLLGVSAGAELIGTVSPTSSAGDTAYFLKSRNFSYSIGGAVGDVMPFSITNANSSDRAVRGTIMVDDSANLTATANSTGRNLGAVAAGKSLFVAAHVVSVSGTSTPTLAVKVQSDDNGSFTSPTDRITLTNFTAVGAQYSKVAGAITDSHFRINSTITGTNPSFKVFITVGIV